MTSFSRDFGGRANQASIAGRCQTLAVGGLDR
jgi:hypothetical protein